MDEQGGVPSQFAVARTFERAKLGVYSNLLKQMQAKLRLDLYRLQLNGVRNTMVCGIDVVNEGKKTIYGFSASYSQNLTQYFSRTFNQERFPKETQGMNKNEQEDFICQKRGDFMFESVKTAMEQYAQKNKGSMPTQIIIYRDGVGGPSFFEKAFEHDTKALQEAIKEASPSRAEGIQVLYVQLNRNISYRIFSRDNGHYLNPPSGSVIDSGLVEAEDITGKKFDFFMVPHKATVATAQPVHFKVCLNTTRMNANDVEKLTFDLCCGYFNFGGPIKVPAPVMYAKKIATYAFENKISEPNRALAFNLHFL